jgi:hypothetical protein
MATCRTAAFFGIHCDLSRDDDGLIPGLLIITAIEVRRIDQVVTVLDVEEVARQPGINPQTRLEAEYSAGQVTKAEG